MAIPIKPLDIKQKTFGKKLFNGYDPDEVSAFLSSLAQAWDRVLEENRDLSMRLEDAERDANRLRELQDSLVKTLELGESTKNQLISEGQKERDFLLREGQQSANAMRTSAQMEADAMKQEAENHAKQTYRELRDEVQKLQRDYQEIDGIRQRMLGEIKNFSTQLLERVDLMQNNTRRVNFDDLGIPAHLQPEEPKALVAEPAPVAEEPAPAPRQFRQQQAPNPLRNRPSAKPASETPEPKADAVPLNEVVNATPVAPPAEEKPAPTANIRQRTELRDQPTQPAVPAPEPKQPAPAESAQPVFQQQPPRTTRGNFFDNI